MLRIFNALALAVLLFFAAPATAHDAHKKSVASAPSEDTGHAVTRSDVATIYGLIDQTGKPAGPERFKGRFSLVVFGYTACPDVCPTALTHVTSVMEKLGDNAKYVQPVFVTFDPLRDTPEVLGEYVSHFHKRTLALTGSLAAIKSVQEGYGVLSIPGPKEADGTYFISHTAAKYLIGPDGSHIESFSHDDPPDRIAGYLKNIFARLGK